jgi:4'-phosphopantetheinyl transferase
MNPTVTPRPPPEWVERSPAALPAAPALDEVQLWLMSLDAPAWPSSLLHDVLDDAERARAARFHFELHRRRFAHGRGLLRHLLGHALGMAPEDLRFAVGAQGKPGLESGPVAETAGDGRCALDFNLSHSGALMLLGLSDGAAIGLDIEVPRAVPELRAIAERNFAAGEQRELLALPPEAQADAFLAGWTRKEAFVKALGGGLSVPLDGFEVSLGPNTPARLLRSADPAHPVGDFMLWAGHTPEGCPCAAVVRNPRASVRTFSLR